MTSRISFVVLAIALAAEKYAGSPDMRSTASVVLLRSPINEGQAIASDQLVVVRVPRAFAPDQAITRIHDVSGHRARIDLGARTLLSQPLIRGSDSRTAMRKDDVVVRVPVDGSGLTAKAPVIIVSVAERGLDDVQSSVENVSGFVVEATSDSTRVRIAADDLPLLTALLRRGDVTVAEQFG